MATVDTATGYYIEENNVTTDIGQTSEALSVVRSPTHNITPYQPTSPQSFDEALTRQFKTFQWQAPSVVYYGDSIFPEWLEVGRELGKGAFGRVIKVSNAQDSTDVKAVKVFFNSYDGVPAMGKSGTPMGEVLALGLGHHPNLIHIDGLMTTQDKVRTNYSKSLDDSDLSMTRVYGVVSSYHDGKDLKRFVNGTERMTPDQIKDVGIQVGRALKHLHENGLVHRDVKPDNILMAEDGTVTLVDLGLLARSESKLNKYSPWGYTPPEFYGKDKMPANEKSDAFSLGVTLTELALGRTLFQPEQKKQYSKMLRAMVAENPTGSLVEARITPEEKEKLQEIGFFDTLVRMTQFKVEDRASIREVLPEVDVEANSD